LKSDAVKAILGDDGGEILLDFIRGCIIQLKQGFCIYLQKGQVRHIETSANSGHEGANHTIKSGPICVLPEHSIDYKSTEIQVDMDVCNQLNLCFHQHLATTTIA
jgi:hypothetical protein